MKRRDPKLFRELAEPFDTRDEANDALTRFLDRLAELRKDEKITNVYVVAQVTALGSNGEEGDYMATCHYGDELRSLALAAYAYGREKKLHEELIARLLKDG